MPGLTKEQIYTQTYYEILGVTDKADSNAIRQAYKKLSLQYHPDKNPQGEEIFKQIQNAYEVLSDEATRRQYDERRNQAILKTLSAEAQTALEALNKQISTLDKLKNSLKSADKSKGVFDVIESMRKELQTAYGKIIDSKGDKKTIETSLTAVMNSADEKSKNKEVRIHAELKGFFQNLMESIKKVLHSIFPNTKVFGSKAEKAITGVYKETKSALGKTVDQNTGSQTPDEHRATARTRGNEITLGRDQSQGNTSNDVGGRDIGRLTGRENPRIK